MKKVAITGASGHVGNVLCRTLIERGIQLNAMIHQSTESLKDVSAAQIKSNLNDSSSLDYLLDGVDTVFHIAAKISLNKKDEKEILKTNLDGTFNLLESCKRNGVLNFIFFSSIHTLEPFPRISLLDETRSYNLHSNLAYDRSKIEAEKLTLNTSHMNCSVIIPTGIIGPFDFGPSLLGQALIKLYHGTLPMLLPYGFNWVDVRDVATAAISAAERSSHASKYIIAGEWKSLLELAKITNQISGRVKLPLICPPLLAHSTIPIMDWCLQRLGKESLYNKASLEILRDSPLNISYAKAEIDLNYKPRHIADSVKDGISWFIKNGKI